MTKDEHRELDKDVHHFVFGFTPYEVDDCIERNALPHYSTEIADAWKVVEVMQHKGLDFALSRDEEECAVIFTDGTRSASIRGANITDSSTPLAICRAALEAVRT